MVSFGCLVGLLCNMISIVSFDFIVLNMRDACFGSDQDGIKLVWIALHVKISPTIWIQISRSPVVGFSSVCGGVEERGDVVFYNGIRVGFVCG